MVKSELVQKISNAYPNILRRDIEKIVDIIIAEIVEALCRNEAVEIRKFGRFSTVITKSRMGRNPRTGSEIHIKPKKKIKYKMSKNLFNRLNKNFTENNISDTN